MRRTVDGVTAVLAMAGVLTITAVLQATHTPGARAEDEAPTAAELRAADLPRALPLS